LRRDGEGTENGDPLSAGYKLGTLSVPGLSQICRVISLSPGWARATKGIKKPSAKVQAKAVQQSTPVAAARTQKKLHERHVPLDCLLLPPMKPESAIEAAKMLEAIVFFALSIQPFC